MPNLGSLALGFVGIGRMGLPMAQNLLKAGYRLFIYDNNVDAMAPLIKLGAKPVDSPAALATSISGLRAIFSMLPSPSHVKEAYCGPDGLLSPDVSGLLQPPLLVDCSTIDPVTAAHIADVADSTILHPDPANAFSRRTPLMIDAPVSGGTPAAQGGTLTFMAGGSTTAIDQARPFLLSMGKRVICCGGHGSGQAAKLANNLALAIQMAGVSEGLAFGQKLGLDASVLTTIFNSSSARCWTSEQYNPVPGVMEGVPSSRGYSGGFSTALMLKDLHLALETGKICDASLPMTKKASELYETLAKKAGTTGLDFSALYKYVYHADDV